MKTIIVGPTPSRSMTRLDSSAPRSAPVAPIEKARPIDAAVRPSSRTAKTRRTEVATLPNRFAVAVQAAMFFRYACPST